MIRALFTSCLVLAMSAPALAQDAQDVTLAREAFQQGVRAAQAENWVQAREHFARSYRINQRLSALMNLATAEERSGQWVEAAEHYREYLDRADAGDENESTVRQALTGLTPRIPRVALSATNLAPEDTVQLDGREVSASVRETPIPVNLGNHEATIHRAGAEVAAESFRVTDESTTVNVSLAAPDVTEEPEVDLRLTPDPTPTDDSGSVLSTWWFWTIVGVVVAGGVTAGILFAGSGQSDPVTTNDFDMELIRLP